MVRPRLKREADCDTVAERKKRRHSRDEEKQKSATMKKKEKAPRWDGKMQPERDRQVAREVYLGGGWLL